MKKNHRRRYLCSCLFPVGSDRAQDRITVFFLVATNNCMNDFSHRTSTHICIVHLLYLTTSCLCSPHFLLSVFLPIFQFFIVSPLHSGQLLKIILFYTLRENTHVFLCLIFLSVTLQFHGFPKNDRTPFFMVDNNLLYRICFLVHLSLDA